MDKAEARVLLGSYRPGVDDPAEPRLAEALEMARRDPELGQWLAKEQAVDAAVAARLREIPVPAALRNDLLALGNVVQVPRSAWTQTWRPAVAGAAVAAVLTWLAALAFLHSKVPSNGTTPTPNIDPTKELASLEDFRAEMVSFVRLAPPLDYESRDPDKLRDYLIREQGPGDMHVPTGLQQLPGMGCRILSFRGHRVALMCFLRKNGQLVHLIVVDKNAMAAFDGTRDKPQEKPEGPWATAAWTEGDLAYMAAVKGDAELLQSYLRGS